MLYISCTYDSTFSQSNDAVSKLIYMSVLSLVEFLILVSHKVKKQSKKHKTDMNHLKFVKTDNNNLLSYFRC